MLQVRVFAVVDETTGSVVWVVLFKVQLFKWGRVLADVVVEGVGVVFLVRDVLDLAELLRVQAAEAVGQTFTWGGVDAVVVVVRVFLFPLGAGIMQGNPGAGDRSASAARLDGRAVACRCRR